MGLDNFQAVLSDPLLATAVLNTMYFALLALILGFPIPIIMAVLMSEVRRGKGLYSALAYLPVVIPPVVSVLLWRVFYDASPNGVFNTLLGFVGIPPQPFLQSQTQAMPALVIEATWAAAGGSIIIYFAALLIVPPELYDAAEVGRRGRLAQDLARDAAPVARSAVCHVDPAGDRDRAGVPRALPLYGRRAGELDVDGVAAHLQVRVHELAWRPLRHGDGAVRDARVFLAIISWVYFRLTNRWSTS